MIACLQGTLHRVEEDSLIILSQGVGYQVFVTRPTLEDLPSLGSSLEMQTHLVIREDSHLLFGFKTLSEKSLFLKLIQVNSIGPKLAMNILSGMPVHELAEAIAKEDLVRLTAIPGIGKKTAERMVVDLKDKIFGLLPGMTQDASLRSLEDPPSLSDEAISALTNLGYSRQEAIQALKAIPKAKELTLEALVREGLKALS